MSHDFKERNQPAIFPDSKFYCYRSDRATELFSFVAFRTRRHTALETVSSKTMLGRRK